MWSESNTALAHSQLSMMKEGEAMINRQISFIFGIFPLHHRIPALGHGDLKFRILFSWFEVEQSDV